MNWYFVIDDVLLWCEAMVMASRYHLLKALGVT